MRNYSFFSQLPLEAWMEILEWLRGYRRQLAAKINQLGDRTFVEICQHWLHKYSKDVQLGELWINYEIMFNNFDGELGKIPRLMVSIEDEPYKVKVPFAQVPMPANITGFVALHIRYISFNSRVYSKSDYHHSATWTRRCSTFFA
jgi:hypothetical protein